MIYCGVYDNALDNDNYNLAKGFNYHQGPVRISFLFSEFSVKVIFQIILNIHSSFFFFPLNHLL